MLEKVRIQNFQSHMDTTVEFIPGTNVIIGASDAGKSTIFRAINWVISNRPLGDAFRSEWGGDTRVTLWTLEGDVIERVRTATKNEYILNGKTMKAFGTEVPEQVLKVLELDSCNIQSQMDPAFLLAMTPGEAAKMLNKAASIDDIDIATSGITRALSRLNSDLDHITAALEKDQERLEEYAALPKVESLLREAEELGVEIESLQSRFEILQAYEKRISDIHNRLDLTKNLPSILERVDNSILLNQEKEQKRNSFELLHRLGDKINEIQSRLASMDSLPSLLDRLEEAEKSLETLQKSSDEFLTFSRLSNNIRRIQGELKKTKDINKTIKLYDKATTQLRSMQKMQKDYQELEIVWGMAEKISSRIIRAGKAISKLTKEYNEIAPDTCPLCGGEMKKCQD